MELKKEEGSWSGKKEPVPLRTASEVKQPVLAVDEGPQAVGASCALSQEISRSRE